MRQFLQINNTVMTHGYCQNLVSAQYLGKKINGI